MARLDRAGRLWSAAPHPRSLAVAPMHLTNKAKRAVFSSVASVVVVVLAGVCMTNIGPDGPGGPLAWVGLVLLFPACMLGGACGPGAYMVIPVLGFLQFFVIFWFMLRRRYAALGR